MMSLLNVVRFFHILFAITWLGGAIYFQSLMISSFRSGDPTMPMRMYVQGHGANKRLLAAAGFGTYLFGVWLIFETFWSLSDLWLTLSLILGAIAIGMSTFYFGPNGEKIVALVEENGVDDPDAAALLAQAKNAARFQVFTLFLMFVLMIFKPGA